MKTNQIRNLLAPYKSYLPKGVDRLLEIEILKMIRYEKRKLIKEKSI
jgi:hypothetical protein